MVWNSSSGVEESNSPAEVGRKTLNWKEKNKPEQEETRGRRREEENSIPSPLKNLQEVVENLTNEVEGSVQERWRSFSLSFE